MRLIVDGKLAGEFADKSDACAAFLAHAERPHRTLELVGYVRWVRDGREWVVDEFTSPSIRRLAQRVRRCGTLNRGTGGGHRVLRKPLPTEDD